MGKELKKSEKLYTEEQVVKQCSKYLKKCGWVPHTMFTGGIPLGGGRHATNPCKGIPDCIAFHLEMKKVIWIEYKRSKGGVLSPEQKQWHFKLTECDQIVMVVNSLESLKSQLERLWLTDLHQK